MEGERKSHQQVILKSQAHQATGRGLRRGSSWKGLQEAAIISGNPNQASGGESVAAVGQQGQKFRRGAGHTIEESECWTPVHPSVTILDNTMTIRD